MERLPTRWAISAIHVFFDAFTISLWISSAVGRESLFALLYLIQILVVSLTLFQKGAWLSSVVASVLFGVVLATAKVNNGLLVWSVYTALFLVLGFVGGYLSEELHRTSESLKEKSRKMERLMALNERIVANLPTGLLTVDHEMVVNFINPAGEAILGIVSQDIVGKELNTGFPGLLPFFEQIEVQKVDAEPGEEEAQDGQTEVSATGTQHHRYFFVSARSEKGNARLQQRVEIGKGVNSRVLRGDVAELDAAAGLGGLLGQEGHRGKRSYFFKTSPNWFISRRR